VRSSVVVVVVDGTASLVKVSQSSWDVYRSCSLVRVLGGVGMGAEGVRVLHASDGGMALTSRLREPPDVFHPKLSEGGGKGVGLDGDGRTVVLMSSVALVIGAVVDVVGWAECPITFSPGLVNVVLSEDFSRDDLKRKSFDKSGVVSSS